MNHFIAAYNVWGRCLDVPAVLEAALRLTLRAI
jgi:hypothetical protein